MNTVTLILLAVAGVALVAWVGNTLYAYVAHDGYGRPRPSQPPRSHYAYFNDPHHLV